MTSTRERNSAHHGAQGSKHERQSFRAMGGHHERAQRNSTGTFNLNAATAATSAPIAEMLAIVPQDVILVLAKPGSRTQYDLLR